jgi:hypothetical protein
MSNQRASEKKYEEVCAADWLGCWSMYSWLLGPDWALCEITTTIPPNRVNHHVPIDWKHMSTTWFSTSQTHWQIYVHTLHTTVLGRRDGIKVNALKRRNIQGGGIPQFPDSFIVAPFTLPPSQWVRIKACPLAFNNLNNQKKKMFLIDVTNPVQVKMALVFLF